MKIIALTNCCVDIYPELDNVCVGGNSLNFASQCKLSGIDDVSIIGAIGDDKYGSLIEQHLDKVGIDRSHLYKIDAPSASNKIYIAENGERYFKDDDWNGGAFNAFRLSGEDLRFLEFADIISMPAGDPNLKTLFKNRSQKQLVTVDYLDYLPLIFIENMIDHVDISFLSARENMLKDLNDLANKSGKMIVATLGAGGSVAFWNNSNYYQEAIKADEIVDTTGCGDAFQAAFVIEWFKSKNIQNSLYQGSLAARNVLSFIGGVR